MSVCGSGSIGVDGSTDEAVNSLFEYSGYISNSSGMLNE